LAALHGRLSTLLATRLTAQNLTVAERRFREKMYRIKKRQQKKMSNLTLNVIKEENQQAKHFYIRHKMAATTYSVQLHKKKKSYTPHNINPETQKFNLKILF
jgi:hypothetical protein